MSVKEHSRPKKYINVYTYLKCPELLCQGPILLQASTLGSGPFFDNWRPLKMITNAFYFMLKALYVFEIFNIFFPDVLVKQENSLIKKLNLISKFMTSETERQINTIHILPNTSTGKGNQAMNFGQLIKNKVINTSQKSCRKRGRGTSGQYLSFNIFW